ncbi:hypothetical protein [Arthrobacter sp. NyZ413]|uniref:hypothetical protein n=1 Tax=Arthrobacter sp. NyZ413 TaxID=3144669 RepID=UPI003BF8B96B
MAGTPGPPGVKNLAVWEGHPGPRWRQAIVALVRCAIGAGGSNRTRPSGIWEQVVTAFAQGLLDEAEFNEVSTAVRC